MVRVSRVVMKNVGNGFNKALSEVVVCPLTRQPLRYCEKTESLISDEIGVSFPNGILMLIVFDATNRIGLGNLGIKDLILGAQLTDGYLKSSFYFPFSLRFPHLGSHYGGDTTESLCPPLPIYTSTRTKFSS